VAVDVERRDGVCVTGRIMNVVLQVNSPISAAASTPEYFLVTGAVAGSVTASR